MSQSGQLLEGLFRDSAGRIVSTLTRILGSRHLELAEECVQDAMIRALEKWPFHGIPDNPAAWLLQAARNRAIDVLRRDRRMVALPADLEQIGIDTTWVDDELGMMLLCCHPSLSRDAQVALTLKTVGGLGVKEIARAYLTPEATMAQRLVRAKRQLREQRVNFHLPDAIADIPVRLDAVLEVLYLLFNEGYTLGARDFSEGAIRLTRLLLANQATALAKCHALLALMLLQSARDAARIDAEGTLVLLRDQNRALWDRRRISEGMLQLDLAATGQQLSRYHLEAGIASQHAVASTSQATDWALIETSYEMLEALYPSPVVRLNHAIATGQVRGALAGLEMLDGLEQELATYQPYHAAQGSFWRDLQQFDRAAVCFRRALELSVAEAEKGYFRSVLASLGHFDGVSNQFA